MQYVIFLLFIHSFALLGLGWGMQDLWSSLQPVGSLVATYKLSCSMWYLVPRPGIELGLPELGVQSLGHWTTREVPTICTLPHLALFSRSILFSRFIHVVVILLSDWGSSFLFLLCLVFWPWRSVRIFAYMVMVMYFSSFSLLIWCITTDFSLAELLLEPGRRAWKRGPLRWHTAHCSYQDSAVFLE